MDRRYGELAKQERLAEAAGISQKTVSNILSGLRRDQGVSTPPPSTTLGKIELIANALGMEVWQLLHPNPDAVSRVNDDRVEVGANDIAELVGIFAHCDKDQRSMILGMARDFQRERANSGSAANDKR